MAKQNRDTYARETEREMRDRMNGIVRDKDGQIIIRNGKHNFRGIDQVFIADGVWKS